MPACGYTQLPTVLRSDYSAAPSFVTTASASQYQVNSNSLTDVGTYNMVYRMVFTNYPAAYTHPNFYSDPFTIQILHPCESINALDAWSVPSSMTTSSLLGSDVLQYFTQPADTISTN